MLSLTYLSSAPRRLAVEELTEMLRSMRTRNEALGITGVLLYSDGNFVQTLEGPDDVVEETFARIAADRRHTGVTVAWREQTEERAFPDWSMGFRELDPEQARDLPGFSDYLARRGRLPRDGEPVFTALVFHRIFRDGAHRS